jgi:hypothetical protein
MIPVLPPAPAPYTAIELPASALRRFLRPTMPSKREAERWTLVPSIRVHGAGRGDIQIAASNFDLPDRPHRPDLPPWSFRLVLPQGRYFQIIPPTVQRPKSNPFRTLWVRDTSSPQTLGKFKLSEVPRLLTWLGALLSSDTRDVHHANQFPPHLANAGPTIPNYSRNGLV